MVEMELVGVRVELPTNVPIVLLRETEGDRRVLPIFIGSPEATAIAFALERVETPRPMTHDLLKNVLDELGVNIDRIVVTELRDSTFFAELHLTRNGRAHTVSSRPSDAIALAVRTGTPIFAEETVLAEAAYPADAAEEKPGEEQDEVVEQFREFIEHVNPEDFGA
ncbi:MAG: bifunctional nuclease family protein [Acidimicrobiales bacterium]